MKVVCHATRASGAMDGVCAPVCCSGVAYSQPATSAAIGGPSDAPKVRQDWQGLTHMWISCAARRPHIRGGSANATDHFHSWSMAVARPVHAHPVMQRTD